MHDYPFFFYQPWPFYMAMIGWLVSALGCIAAWRAWQIVRKLTRMLNAMRTVLQMQERSHEAEVRKLIERFGGRAVNGTDHITP